MAFGVGLGGKAMVPWLPRVHLVSALRLLPVSPPPPPLQIDQ